MNLNIAVGFTNAPKDEDFTREQQRNCIYKANFNNIQYQSKYLGYETDTNMSMERNFSLFSICPFIILGSLKKQRSG